jgi:hypothetical protein
MYTSGESPHAVTDWTSVWLVPAGIAGVVLLLFILFFRDNKKLAD